MSRKRKSKIIRSTLVSVIIPVYGRFDLLRECLLALPDAFSVPYDVILIDNNSPEQKDADEFYSQLPAEIRVIRNKTNEGFPKACNKAAKYSNSSLLFFLNSDVILHPKSADLLVRAMDDPIVGVCGMKLLFPKEDSTKQGLMGPPGSIQHVGLSTNIRMHFYHHFIGWSADNPRANSVKDVYAVTGAALMTRRNLWHRIGGFFLGYGLGTYEDVEYSLAVRDLGYNVIVEPKAVGIHYTGASAREYGHGYDLSRNYQVFIQRWKNKIMYTEWNVL